MVLAYLVFWKVANEISVVVLVLYYLWQASFQLHICDNKPLYNHILCAGYLASLHLSLLDHWVLQTVLS